MNSKIILLFTILFFSYQLASGQNPPVAKKAKKVLTDHGHKRIDNYYWIKDEETPEIMSYLKAENEYTRLMLKPTEVLQNKLFTEISTRKPESKTSVPVKKNGYYYFTRFMSGKQYKVYYRIKDSLEAKEELLFDANEIAAGKRDFTISGFGLSVSPNNRYLVFGYESYDGNQLKFKDLTTGKWLKDEIENVTCDAVWANDNKTIFYTAKNKIGFSNKVKKHILGDDPKNDKLVYSERNPSFYVYLYKSKSGKFIFLRSESYITNEHSILDTDKPEAGFKVFQKREKNIMYYLEHIDNRFFILTNYNAENYRVMVTTESQTSKEYWKELVPESKDVYIYNVEPFKDFLALEVRKDGMSQIEVLDLNNLKTHFVKQDEDFYTVSVKMVIISYNHETETDWLRYDYASTITPGQVILYNMRTGEKKISGEINSINNYTPSDYEYKRVWATAGDGTKIPISLLYKKGMIKNGQNPLLLTGYGGGGWMSLNFYSDRISLLDRGFIYAMAHIRGDEDLGAGWREDGKLLKKMNTFTDFIACAEFLVTEGYTNSQKLFAQGGSAGGLLMGVVVNLKPELFKGVIANSPWMDVVTSLYSRRDAWAWDEYGNPRKKVYYDYLLKYSPYDNIESKNYPAMLVTTGIGDYFGQVAKYVAKMRSLKTDENLLLLYTDMTGGHSGPSGRFDAMRAKAMQYAFLIQLAGIKE